MKYIIKKFFSMIVTLVVVSFCVFLAFNVIPGDPALRKLGTEASQELIEQTRQQMGLNDPLLVRYARWFTSKLPGVISLRKALPIWPMEKGSLARMERWTLRKLTYSPWAFSGRR